MARRRAQCTEVAAVQRFVSVSDDGTAKVWTHDGTLMRTIDVKDPDVFAEVRHVACLPDGEQFVLATTSTDGLLLCNINDGIVHKFDKSGVVISVALTFDGQHIISGSEAGHVKVWSVATKSLLPSSALYGVGLRAAVACCSAADWWCASRPRMNWWCQSRARLIRAAPQFC